MDFTWKPLSILSHILLLCASWITGLQAVEFNATIIGEVGPILSPDCSDLEPPRCAYTYSTDPETGDVTFDYYLETCTQHQCIQINPTNPSPPPPHHHHKSPPPPAVPSPPIAFKERISSNTRRASTPQNTHPTSPPTRRPPPPRGRRQPPPPITSPAIAFEKGIFTNTSRGSAPQKTIHPTSPVRKRRFPRVPYSTVDEHGKFVRDSDPWFCHSIEVGYMARVETGTGLPPGAKEDQWAQCHYSRAESLVTLGTDCSLEQYGCSICLIAYRIYLCAMAFPKCQPAVNGLTPGAADVYGPDTFTVPQQQNLTYTLTKPCRGLCYDLIRFCEAQLQFSCHLKESRDWGDLPGCNYAGSTNGGSLYQ